MKPRLMLAKKVTQTELEEWSQMKWEDHYIEPKIDGERFVRSEVGVWVSRQGKPKYNVNLITNAIDRVRRFSDYLIDGELFGGDWSSTITAAHSHHKTGIRLQYRIFDVVPLKHKLMPLMDRKEIIGELLHSIKSTDVVAVESTIVSSFSDFKQVFDDYCAKGCDGAIIKTRKGPYEFKRSKHWLKIKPYSEMDCKIVGFDEGEGKYEGTLGSISVRVPITRREGGWSQHITHVGTGMNDEERDNIWKNREKLIGKLAEVRYRAISPKKIRLIEPRLIRIRVDKDAD